MQKPSKSERVSNTWPSTPRKREKEAILEHLLCARPQDGHLTNLTAFIFFLIFGQAHGTWKFPDRGSNLHPSSNPSCCSDRSLTPCSARELRAVSIFDLWQSSKSCHLPLQDLVSELSSIL